MGVPYAQCSAVYFPIFDDPDLIDEAVRQHGIAIARHIHVAHDIAAAGDAPRLEFLGRGIEAHDGVGLARRTRCTRRAPLVNDDAVGSDFGPLGRRATR
jgi:hypothetical protein